VEVSGTARGKRTRLNLRGRALCSGLLLIFATFVAQGSSVPRAVEVRVRQTAGGPQIHVDGKPVAPRFFWGRADLDGPIVVGKEWAEHSFEFVPERLVAGDGTLHFRFADMPGEVWLSDLRIVDGKNGSDVLPVGSLATPADFGRAWKVWPVGITNAAVRIAFDSNALCLTLPEKWPAGTQAQFHVYTGRTLSFVKGRRYRCVFRAKAASGQQLSPEIYRVDRGVHNRIGGQKGPFLEQVALARGAGVRLISFMAPPCWTVPEEAQDWGELDALFRAVIAVHPEALLVPRIKLNAPEWWLKRHPDARMVFDDGKATGTVSSVSDQTYRTDACAHMERLCRHLSEAFPEHFAGIHPAGQNSSEWFYYDAWMHPLSGYDRGTREAFRRWLKGQGAPDAAIAEPPTAEERRAKFGQALLRDPVSQRRVIEFVRFRQEEMADQVLALARACRRGMGDKKLVLFFYGYAFEFPSLSNGAAESGHYALGKLLREQGGDIDILCAPISYYDRSWLGTAPCMVAAESVKRAGVLWLSEDDSRTYLDLRKQEHVQEGGLDDREQTRQVMLRNTAQAALRGFGTWWMDLYGQGWHRDAAVWNEQVRLQPVEEAMLRRKAPFTPEIAAIIDEESMCRLTVGSAVAAGPLISKSRAAFGRCGAPYGQYLFPDVLDGKVSARMQVFLAAWSLTPAQRQALAAQRKRGCWRRLAGWLGADDDSGLTRVWCWAPGYLYPDRADVRGIREVTGFEARVVTLPTAEVTPTALGALKGLKEAWGPKRPICPLFAVEATADEVLATYSDGSPAVALRRSGAGLDVFVGVPQLTPELVHAIAAEAGVHLFTRPGPALWAAEGCLSIQAQTEGPVRLDTGCGRKVFDALDDTPLGQGPAVDLEMRQGEVRVLRY